MRKVLLVADVDNWAWANKARQKKKNLDDKFKIDIVNKFWLMESLPVLSLIENFKSNKEGD